jgi:hypothetical protein
VWKAERAFFLGVFARGQTLLKYVCCVCEDVVLLQKLVLLQWPQLEELLTTVVAALMLLLLLMLRLLVFCQFLFLLYFDGHTYSSAVFLDELWSSLALLFEQLPVQQENLLAVHI